VKLLRPTHHGLHWVLDVTMNEDQARSHKDHGPQNMALLRRLALNLAKLEGSKESMKGKLYRAALSDCQFPKSAAVGCQRRLQRYDQHLSG